MYCSYDEIVAEIKNRGQVMISVAVAQDKEVLSAIKMVQEVGIAQAILVGDAALITPMLAEVGLSNETKIIHEADITKAAQKAVSIVKRGQAQVLMKGLINSSDFLRAVLHKEEGLRTGRLLSHLGAFEIPGQKKLLFITDGGMNIAPTVEEKKEILLNSMLALQAMGIKEPHVAVLTANEVVNGKMPATVDAQTLTQMSAAGQFPLGIIEGPIALDVAVSQDAAKHKGITSKVSGNVDLILVPNIETGNALGKSLIYFANSKMAGIVLGATHPIVMTSRSETPEGKMNSIALACLVNSNIS
ncbi:bifunctional enoyl-CoA hydratase/phosphate acetyltransferase [Pelosinus sp. UFO1]|uniref:bifunctional enoyl-CoA hydratase/phosphate acetyltransferase n=1 Tax=Pelosinus sp. UFO1 TaxID=484770 RepID=UPI0004D1221A|nr:bifunctional enoyl-CoA hydratase/phosphate acetyltransferase [Pelosinus sp. UFO1]AIF50553.1 Phosphate butyryltransferase [Pelosinus sp. UFO1]